MEKDTIPNNLYIASLVLGIISMIFCAIPICGLILSIISLLICKKARKKLLNTNENRGIVTAGFVLSIISIVISTIVTVFLIVIPLGGTFILKVTTPVEVNIPNVVGLTVEEAENKIKNAGLKFVIEKEINDESRQDNVVISQDPKYNEAFNKVKKGSTVKIIVNKGK